ncbi:MAG: M14 family zinc carboxypeptidase [Minisyncoccia bacterium]
MKFSYKLVITILLICIIGVILLLIFSSSKKVSTQATVVEEKVDLSPAHTIIGKSVEGRDIEAYTFGVGKTRIVFVGGIHGGYEWNTSVLAYRLLDYLKANSEFVSEKFTVTIIPNANPDGVFKIIKKEGRFTEADVPKGVATQPGRFNANDVDLNRNFDCKWQPKSTWQSREVSAGVKPFSEPESLALKKFIEEKKPRAVIFWHSQGGEVYASECQNGILPETLSIMNAYSKASGYGANPTYDAYQTTGDADAWLAKIGIPSITVELKTHESAEWQQNLSGVKSVLDYYDTH